MYRAAHYQPRQAIWLEATEEFKWASAARRNKPSSRFKSSDPERFVRNWFGRDMLIAAHVRQGVEERGLTLLEVDGSKSLVEMAALVEAHFAPLLATSNLAIVGSNVIPAFVSITWRNAKCGPTAVNRSSRP